MEVPVEDDSGLQVTITDDDGGMVTRWVLVAEVIDVEGVESLRLTASPGMAQWDQLGMHHFAGTRIADGCDCG